METAGDGGGCEGLSSFVADDADRDWAEICGVGLGIKGALVCGGRAEGYTPIANIQDASLVFRVGLLDFKLEAGFQGFAGACLVVRLHLRNGGSAFEEIPIRDAGPIGLKSAVADQLCVEAAVVRKVDFLSHESVKNWTHGTYRLIRMNCKNCGRSLRVSEERSKGDGGLCDESSKRFPEHAKFSLND